MTAAIAWPHSNPLPIGFRPALSHVAPSGAVMTVYAAYGGGDSGDGGFEGGNGGCDGGEGGEGGEGGGKGEHCPKPLQVAP